MTWPNNYGYNPYGAQSYGPTNTTGAPNQGAPTQGVPGAVPGAPTYGPMVPAAYQADAYVQSDPMVQYAAATNPNWGTNMAAHNMVNQATGGFSVQQMANQAYAADYQWKMQQQTAPPQTGQPGAAGPQQPGAQQPGAGTAAIDAFDFKKLEGMSEADMKKALEGLNIGSMTPQQKDYLTIKLIEALSKNEGDDKGLNKIAETLGIDHDNLTDDEFSAHDFHVIRDVLNKIAPDKGLGDIVDNFAHEDGTSNRTYIAKAVGSDTTGWFGKEYFQKGDWSKVLGELQKGKSINDLIAEGRKKE